ncbi:MAG: hypothetical protein ABI840_12415, partial [bacterium]
MKSKIIFLFIAFAICENIDADAGDPWIQGVCRITLNNNKIVEGFIDLNRIDAADKEYFIGQFNQKGFSLFAKSKIRFE